MGKKIGLELEFHILNQNGEITNQADNILGHELNGGYILKELSQSMVEVIAEPSDDLDIVCTNFKQQLIRLQEITDSLNLRVLPSSSVGQDAVVKSNDYFSERGYKKRRILGDFKRNLEHHLCGTHVHIDKSKDDKLFRQYLVTQAMDPVFSLMSSTPFLFSENTKKDYRVEVYRNQIFEDFPAQGQLYPYFNSLSDISELQNVCLKDWISKLNEYHLNSKGFTETDAFWGPIRMLPKTIESRGSDSNKLSNVMALASLYKGITELLDDLNFKVEINDNDNDYSNLFVLRNNKLTIPSYVQLKKFEKAGINDGLSNVRLLNYLNNILSVSDKGLDNNQYLRPFKLMIKERSNFSNEIIQFSINKGYEGSNMKLKKGTENDVRNYIADEYIKDLRVY